MSFENDAFSQAIRQNFQWSIQLADQLAADGKWDAYPWRTLINTWSSMELDLSRHTQVLAQLARTELYSNLSYQIAEALYALVSDDGPSYAIDLLPHANRIAQAFWTSLDRNVELDLDRGWYKQSVDYPVWDLVNYWLSSVFLWRNNQNPQPSRLSDEYQQVFSDIVKDPSQIGSIAKSMFAARLDFLLAVDKCWTEHHLLPFFDPRCEDFQIENFQAVWDGFLAKKQLNHQTAELMSKVTLKAATRINTDLFNQSRGFITFYTTMLIKHPQCTNDPVCDWIPKLFERDSKIHPSHKSKLKSLWREDNTTLELFIWEISGYFQNLDADEKRELWSRWLKEFWQNLLDGVLVSMTAREVKYMLDWLVDLKSVFPEAVELATQMPPPILENTRIPAFLVENRMWESHPEEVAQLLIYLSTCIELRRYLNSAMEIVEALIGSDISSELLPDLEDIRAQLTD